jgi:ubiquinone/menaquinone biosynthesis C-methylase UbiE
MMLLLKIIYLLFLLLNGGVSMLEDELSRIEHMYAKRASDPVLQRRYSLLNPATLHHVQSLEKAILADLVRFGISDLAECRILDVGCGSGGWLARFLLYGAKPERLAGIDLLPARVAQAQAVYPSIAWKQGDASRLPYSSASFDIVMTFTMFSSIKDATLRAAIAAEMWRVLDHGGLLFIYDFTYDNPANPAVCAIPKRELSRLFPHAQLTFRKLTLAPPLTRLFATRIPFLVSVLEFLSIFNTHLLAVARKKEENLCDHSSMSNRR